MHRELLDKSLLLEADGHLSEVGAATLADGQEELVPVEIWQHVEGCPECLDRLGAEALNTELVQRLVESLEAPQVEAVTPQRVPWWALLAAAALALLGALPTVIAAETREAAQTTLRVLPAALMTLQQAMQEPEVAAALERARWWGSAVLMVAGLVLVAAVTRNKEEGEVR